MTGTLPENRRHPQPAFVAAIALTRSSVTSFKGMSGRPMAAQSQVQGNEGSCESVERTLE